MKNKSLLAAITLCATAVPAMAQTNNFWNCSSATFTSGTAPTSTVPYAVCKGSYDPKPEPAPGNDDVDAVNSVLLGTEGYVAVGYQYKDNIQEVEVGSDVSVVDFEQGTGATGTVTFGVNLFDPFVLTLKFGEEWSAYWFTQDVLAGTTWSFSTTATQNTLSHGSLFTTAAIPEPETYALMLAGLVAVAFVARRRKVRGN